MIVSRTPLRVSFVGGGTDLPAFYQHRPGAVVSTTIDKYVYIVVNPRFHSTIRVGYSRTEIVETPIDLEHELVREALLMLGIDKGIEIVSIADVPAGTGLGSSSSFTVGLLNALHAYLGQRVGPEQLAQEACEIEINRCGKPIGKQDQYAAAYGGLRYMRFLPDRHDVQIEPVLCWERTRRLLEEHLMLLYTGQQRKSSTILATQGKEAGDHLDEMSQMAELAIELRRALGDNYYQATGDLLHMNWVLKRSLADGISNAQLDWAYREALLHGARGGKITGAGGGGFLLLYAPPDCQSSIEAALPELRRLPFHFTQAGSQIIYKE
jgi:D-glycero-alpha-D-manno-heptose-7-phosphate kinase